MIVRFNVPVPGPVGLVAVRFTAERPGAVGVPEMRPVVLLTDNPGGRGAAP